MTRRTTPSTLLIPPDSELAESPFVAMDFETANRLSGVSACQIALVRVADGVVTEELDTASSNPLLDNLDGDFNGCASGADSTGDLPAAR